MNNSPLYKLTKKFGGIKCPNCNSKNVEQGTMLDFEADECFDCGLKYTSSLRNRLSILLFFWIWGTVPAWGGFFLYKGQPDYQVWLFIAAMFVIPFALMLFVQHSRKYKEWDESKAKSDQIKYYTIFGLNLAAIYTLFEVFGT